MTNTPPAAAINCKYSKLLLIAFIVAGLIGNYLSFQIFLSIDFIFGSIFAMLALQFFSTGRAVFAAAVIAGSTWSLWNHPYAVIIMTAEVVAVAILMERRKIGMVLADMLFWIIAGIPLVFLFYYIVMDVSLSNTCMVATKQAVNGIANALIARLIFTAYALRSRLVLLSYREIAYNLLAFFVLIPALLLLSVSGRADFIETDLNIRSSLNQDGLRVAKFLESWVKNRHIAIANLAEMAATRLPQQMLPHLEQATKSDANFLRVGLLNINADVTAYYPLKDELGVNNIGKNFADRPFIPVLKQTLKPMLSEVVMGKIGVPRPVVVMLAPVVVHGEYGGYASGTLSMEQIAEYLEESVKFSGLLYTLLDKNSNVIMTNRNDQKVMTPFVRGRGTLNRLDTGVDQWMPALAANIPASERWQGSFYVAEKPVGMLAEWRLILEQPVAPYQKKLYDNYSGKFAMLFLILLLSLSLAELLSRQLVSTIDRLRQITGSLLSGDESGTLFTWPESRVLEMNDLIINFHQMYDNIRQHLDVLEYINESLEQRVGERTEQLSAITHELGIILENAPIGISKMIGRQQIWVNHYVEQMLQYSKNDLEFHETRKLYVSDEAYEKLGRDSQPVLAQGQLFESEQELVRKDGKTILVRYIGQAIDPPDMNKGIIWIVEDITERKNNQEALVEANRFSDQIILGVQEGVVVYDLNLRYRVWNPYMEQISGMFAGEVIGKHPSELFPFLQASGVIDRLKQVLAGDALIKTDFQYSIPSTGKSGWSSDVSAPLRNSKGEVIGVIATVRDISDRKRNENELLQALEMSKDANLTMNRLLRTVAHEFRTPLGLLAGSADVLDRYWDRLTPEERLVQNDHIRSAVQQLSDLLNSVISYKFQETDKSVAAPKMLDIDRACRDIAGEVEAVWSLGQQFSVTISSECGIVFLDRSLLRRVLENLLTNAFRYTPLDGSVSLYVSRDNFGLLFEISDTGIGIPDADQELIFDAFYRSSNVEGRYGLGLGLSIVSEALRQLGGTITVTSRIGEGTSARVVIPTVQQENCSDIGD